MKNLFATLSMLLLFPVAGRVPAADLPHPDAVAGAIHEAASFFRTRLSVAGGYASGWPGDLSEGRSEHRASSTVISIQPPGTPTVGMALLAGYRATGNPLLWQGAREAASALLWCQLSSGGWGADFDFDPAVASRYHFRRDVLAGDEDAGKRSANSTLDDHATTSALLFLLEMIHTPSGADERELTEAVRFGFDGLIRAQYPNGAWPQQYSGTPATGGSGMKASIPAGWPREWPDEEYAGYYTLNDNNLLQVMRLLLRAAELTGEKHYTVRAKRLGDFLLLAQHDEPHPGWSQQYNEKMEPAWARKFEPPAISSTESVGAIDALLELWIATGEERYRDTLPAALDWLERCRLPDGQWARFYELETNRPLYCESVTYRLTYEDDDLPTHYGFKVGSLSGKIERFRATLERPRDDLLRSRADPDSEAGWEKLARSLKSKVGTALETQEPDGYWLDGDVVQARLFVRHVSAMSRYVMAARRVATPIWNEPGIPGR
ncbi:pectate lyase [soil metagenome]